jgi:hypothetical protein
LCCLVMKNIYLHLDVSLRSQSWQSDLRCLVAWIIFASKGGHTQTENIFWFYNQIMIQASINRCAFERLHKDGELHSCRVVRCRVRFSLHLMRFCGRNLWMFIIFGEQPCSLCDIVHYTISISLMIHNTS